MKTSPKQPIRPKSATANSSKLLVRLLLGLGVFLFLMMSMVNPSNSIILFLPTLLKSAHNYYTGFTINHEFLSNPSFEKPITANGTLPNWNHFAWESNQKTAADGSVSLSTIDLVTIPEHRLSQTIIFLFLGQSNIKLSLAELPPLHKIDQKIVLTLHNFDLTQTHLEWQVEPDQKIQWQYLSHVFAIPKSAYRLDLLFVVNSKEPNPVVIDNFSLKLQPSF